MTDDTNTPEDNSLQALLPDELKGINALKDFKTPADLAKSYVNTKEKIGSMVTIPGDDADTETRSKFFNRLGRPESIEGYDFVPEEVQGLKGVTTVNTDNLKQFKEKAHNLGLTKSQAKGMMDHVQSVFSKQLNEQALSLANAADSSSKELRSSWGASYEKNLGHVDSALSQFFTEDNATMMKQAAAQDPNLMKSLATIGASMSESPTDREGTVSSAPPTREDAKEKISAIQANKEHAYWHKANKDHKQATAEMNELYKQAYDNQ